MRKWKGEKCERLIEGNAAKEGMMEKVIDMGQTEDDC
jgi:hypothetical protein